MGFQHKQQTKEARARLRGASEGRGTIIRVPFPGDGWLRCLGNGKVRRGFVISCDGRIFGLSAALVLPGGTDRDSLAGFSRVDLALGTSVSAIGDRSSSGIGQKAGATNRGRGLGVLFTPIVRALVSTARELPCWNGSKCSGIPCDITCGEKPVALEPLGELSCTRARAVTRTVPPGRTARAQVTGNARSASLSLDGALGIDSVA
eukprot:scaffold161480_cov38-Tisochrysis_lutea.AAC.2